MKNRLFMITALLTCVSAVIAQTTILLTGEKHPEDTRVRVSNYQVVQTDGKTVVSLDFLLDSLNVPSNRYRAFTPVVISRDGTHQQRLKTFIVTGRTQDIIFERDGIDEAYADNYVKVRRQKGEAQAYSYTDAVTKEPWHQGASVYMLCDLCGCGDPLKNEMAYLGDLSKPDPYDLISLSDIVPAPQKKERSLHGTAYITFVVNKWDMMPEYMNNRHELRKITDTLDVMVQDPNVSVRQVRIHGWASPESPYKHNEMLATNRAKSLTEYVKKQYNLPANVFAPAEATPENWVGLRQAVVETAVDILPHKQQILSIIDDRTLDPDPKERKIKQQYPAEYRYLLKNVYPGLRRSDYEISFNFSDFTLEQAKEIYKTKPYQLSLREMWDVAQTLEPYGNEYNKVMQTAVNIYPDAPDALVNLANVAIRQHDLLKAESLLERAGDSGEALNARAVIAIIQERYADAESLLQQASRKDLDPTKRSALSLGIEKNLDAIKQLK
jgi:hypothetical protein